MSDCTCPVFEGRRGFSTTCPVHGGRTREDFNRATEERGAMFRQEGVRFPASVHATKKPKDKS